MNAGIYRLVEMLKSGGKVQDQLLCVVFKPEIISGHLRNQWSKFFLTMEAVSKGYVFAVLPKTIADWRKKDGPNGTKKLPYDALRKVVHKFVFR